MIYEDDIKNIGAIIKQMCDIRGKKVSGNKSRELAKQYIEEYQKNPDITVVGFLNKGRGL